LSDPTNKRETQAFSKKCQVITTGTGMECKNCKALTMVNNQRSSRREKQSQLDLPASDCNKRFLSKEEVVKQLKEENRKDKFAVEALELEKEV